MSEDIARRDFFVDRTVRGAREDGVEVDAERVTRDAARDLAMLDRAKALGDIREPEKRSKLETPPPVERPRHDRVASFAQQMGATTWEAPISLSPEKQAPKLYGDDMVRATAMQARILLLMSPVPGYKLKITKDPKTGVITDCEPLGNACRYPAFANRLITEFSCFAGRRGTYAEMKYADRWRKHLRAVEDILDKSDAAVGVNWWVK